MQKKSSFTERVYKVVSKIPEGQVLSYGEVALLAGNPKACRAVGNILNRNRNPDIPCHRVIRSDGTIGGFALGSDKKRKILQTEGYL